MIHGQLRFSDDMSWRCCRHRGSEWRHKDNSRYGYGKVTDVCPNFISIWPLACLSMHCKKNIIISLWSWKHPVCLCAPNPSSPLFLLFFLFHPLISPCPPTHLPYWTQINMISNVDIMTWSISYSRKPVNDNVMFPNFAFSSFVYLYRGTSIFFAIGDTWHLLSRSLFSLPHPHITPSLTHKYKIDKWKEKKPCISVTGICWAALIWVKWITDLLGGGMTRANERNGSQKEKEIPR